MPSPLLLLRLRCRAQAASFRSTDITGADFGKNFTLTDHNGQPRTLADFRGKVVVVFFGFTHCPDVCPTTLAELARAVKKLGPDGDRVQVLLVTVDPERDTPEILKQYVTAFDPRFLGLTGDADAIARTAQRVQGVLSRRIRAPTPDNYTRRSLRPGRYVFDPTGPAALAM